MDGLLDNSLTASATHPYFELHCLQFKFKLKWPINSNIICSMFPFPFTKHTHIHPLSSYSNSEFFFPLTIKSFHLLYTLIKLSNTINDDATHIGILNNPKSMLLFHHLIIIFYNNTQKYSNSARLFSSTFIPLILGN